ncbi:hypothetical protein [Spirulina sp. 06S082]|uniref:hypothetical protein n=1 Tax=Spirulina sp. 06S082 TaxID=3110248 RepID=UPI002B1F160D|nr:hypothetical protein [Spirulina sp. 06S082]MEA5467569.1 hypothetical protein [Spirulina sp. 06S082]
MRSRFLRGVEEVRSRWLGWFLGKCDRICGEFWRRAIAFMWRLAKMIEMRSPIQIS